MVVVKLELRTNPFYLFSIMWYKRAREILPYLFTAELCHLPPFFISRHLLYRHPNIALRNCSLLDHSRRGLLAEATVAEPGNSNGDLRWHLF